IYGGGPLNKQTGDYLTSQHVSIFILYGSSEAGIVTPILPAQVGYDWDYFKFPAFVTAEMVPHGDNKYEFVLVSNDLCQPAALNTTIAGVAAYASSDLMEPHPRKSNYWRVYGRADDQIMHSTGEKTNPGPLETILNQDTHILSAVMFGRGRFQAGVIVDPKPAYQFGPSDPTKLAEFRNLIWPTIQEMNTFAPQHSRLFKEVNVFMLMILVAKPTKPFTYTAKTTARRQAIIADYQDEITQLYEAVEETTQSSIPAPDVWDAASTLGFVRHVVHKVLVNQVNDDNDIFRYGCDSLQATWIRNSLLRALRDSIQLDAHQTTQSFVYDHPTISGLASFIFALVSGKEETYLVPQEVAMTEMATKFTHNFPSHTGTVNPPPPDAKVVAVTGTTGELGCYILSRLFHDKSVCRVYALNRVSRKAQNLRERQHLALVDRGLDATILSSQKIVLLETDLSIIRFNLFSPVYEEMQQSVTHIIHTAWPVDFNLALHSFEGSLKGLRALVDFSLRSVFKQPPMLIYTSSIGVFQNISHSTALTETALEPKIAAGNGYTESKWIAEEILRKAQEATALRGVAVRVGQLSGGPNGAWNINEWVPALVQASAVLGCIPDGHKDVTWLPVDVAAAAIVELLAASPASVKPILNLVHPHPISWTTLARIMAAELSVPIVPYTQWLDQLEKATERDKEQLLRASHLIQFFQAHRSKAESEGDAFGSSETRMDNMMDASISLRSQVFPLERKDVQQWLEYWRGAGLFK
ncbi:male sterility protein-domain-containing protein, partial [Mycena filopes]